MSARARLLDRAGRYLIAAGGIGIIAAVLGIFVFIARETYPLFQKASMTLVDRVSLAGRGPRLVAEIDPYQKLGFTVRPAAIDFFAMADGKTVQRVRPQELTGEQISAAYVPPAGEHLVLGLDDGRVLLAEAGFKVRFEGEVRKVEPHFEMIGAVPLVTGEEALERLSFRQNEEGASTLAGITRSGRVVAALRQVQQGLFGPGEVEETIYDLSEELVGVPTAVLCDGLLRQILVGTDRGQIFEWRLRGVDAAPEFVGSFDAGPAAITALEYVLGEVSIVVGDSDGGVSTWFKVGERQERRYRMVHRLAGHGAAVEHIAPSERDKQFFTVDITGQVALHHATSEQTFFRIDADKGVAAVDFAPKADGLLVVDRQGGAMHYDLDNPHPEISLRMLFGKVWYEGYAQPEYVWQSTGGTDEFEPKLSLVPLIFGTAKGMFYALLFALPVGVLAALYTAEFATPQVRNTVKPIVEVMASLPSVILGFLAGLWLAPVLEHRVVGIGLMLLFIPLLVVLTAWGWQRLPRQLLARLPRQSQLVVLVAVVLFGVTSALTLGPVLEGALFGGLFKDWLLADAGTRFDQRNCLIIGFAMGFAVIPLIFTICEDALSSVPDSLRAGSLALGASRWQTAIKVVLPMATPGIFSAAMIGFGRAVGETMIVLMATGNTPIMEWNIFTGMRAIAANIAVELPEAPHQGTLYRVLFLSGLLLFVITFAVNSLAEVVRQRLRERYKQL